MIPDIRDDGYLPDGRLMITRTDESQIAQVELQDLQDRLEILQRDHPIREKGFANAGIR